MIDFDGFGRPTLPPIQEPALEACPHSFGVGLVGGGWTLVDNEWDLYNNLWVHADPNCRLPSRATLAKHLSTKGS